MNLAPARPGPRFKLCNWIMLGMLSIASLPALSSSKSSIPASKAGTGTNTPEIAEKQADLGELRQRIESMRKELSNSEGSQADAADRLRASEREISRLQRELHEFAGQRNKLQEQLKTLEQQQRELGGTLEIQQRQLEKLLYRQYLRGTPDALQLLVNGSDPNQLARDWRYLSAIALTRAEMMGEITATLERKKQLSSDIKERSVELAELESQQQHRHAELKKQREERKLVYNQISEKVRNQRKEIGNLQQDEQRLTRLISRLSALLAAQTAAKAAELARATEAAKATEKIPRPKSVATPETESKPSVRAQEAAPQQARTETENQHEPAASSGSFARLRGNLRLPVRGSLIGRFGAARDGGGQWRGLFIKAGSGSEVKAIANGRVVFADWMRGFGNLLIVDHGDAYLSIYGSNESLLKQVGQSVRGGESIATVGNSGGNPDSGLYFELRHQGQPIDPMKWASLK